MKGKTVAKSKVMTYALEAKGFGDVYQAIWQYLVPKSLI